MFGKNKDKSETIKSNASQYGAGAKYGSVLTMILVVVIVAIIGIIGYFAYDIYHQNATNAGAASAISDFEAATQAVKKKTTNTTDDEETTAPTDEEIQASIDAMKETESNDETETTTTETEKVYYEGYEVVGYISIPKTNCEYPILSEVTKHSLEVAVAVLYGPGVNEVGNTVIVGHNYRNGLFFSNNSKLTNGDTIKITSATETVTYVIYNMYYTTADDADYMKRDTEGTREISLSTCNDDSSQRLIIWAREQS